MGDKFWPRESGYKNFSSLYCITYELYYLRDLEQRKVLDLIFFHKRDTSCEEITEGENQPITWLNLECERVSLKS